MPTIIDKAKMLALVQTLKEQMGEEEQYGPPLPLNEAAQAEQRRHCETLDPMLDRLKQAERALRNVREEIEDEQQRWHRNMVIAMPEVKDLEGFRITDDQKHYEPQIKDTKAEAKPPAWVTEMLGELPN